MKNWNRTQKALWLIGSMALAAWAPRLTAANRVWSNLSGGNWSTPGNWNPAGVPNSTDAVFINQNGTYTVNLDVDATVQSLTVGGGTGAQTLSSTAHTLRFQLPSSVLANGQLVVNGGTLGNTNLAVAAGGQLTIGGTTLTAWDNLRLNNAGTVRWLGGEIRSSFTPNTAAVTNTGVFQIETDNLLNFPFGGAKPVFVNAAGGTVRKLTGTGATGIQNWPFYNAGTVDVQSGRLAFNGDGGGNMGGSWTTSTGTQIRFEDGSFACSSAIFSGAGVSRMVGGSLSLSGAAAPSGLLLEGGTLQLTPTFQGGSITNLTLHGIALAGSNSLTGTLTTTNGTYRGWLDIAPAGQWLIGGSGIKLFDGLRLSNRGTIRWLAGEIRSQFTPNTASITNAGLWRIEVDELINFPFGGSQPVFVNAVGGTLRKVSGTGTTTIQNWPFHNLGTVEVQSGNLAFNSTGGGTLGGTWTTSAGTQIRFEDGSFVGAGGVFGGAGLSRTLGGSLRLVGANAPVGLRLEGGSAVLDPTFQGGSITNLTLHGIALTGSNNLTGTLTTTNGTYRGSLDIAPTGQWLIAGSGIKLLDGLRLNNRGTVRWLEGEIRSQFNPNTAAITNAGLWRIEVDDVFNFPFGGVQPVFVNAVGGTVRKVAGAGTTTIQNWPFHNFGTVDVQSGNLVFNSSGGGTIAGTWTTSAGTQIRFEDGSFVAAGAVFSGAGLSRMTGGSIRLGGASAPVGLLLEGGSLVLEPTFQGGSITNLTLNGITLAGTNTVTGTLTTTNGTFRGILDIGPTGQWLIGGSGIKLFDGLRLNNRGTIRWLAGEIRSQFNPNTASVTNAGLWRIEVDDSLNFPFGGVQPVFVNAVGGTLRKVAGAGTTTIQNWPFHNLGTVEVENGTLVFSSSGGGTLAGTWTTSASTQIRFEDGSFLGAGGVFGGAGLSRMTGGSIRLVGANAPVGLRLEGGTLVLDPTFQGGTITNLTLHGIALAGTNSVTGTLTTTNGIFRGWLDIAPSGQWLIAGSGIKLFDGLRLNNRGTVRWLAGEIRSQFNPNTASVTNAGLWRIETDDLINFPFGGVQPVFVNAASGTLRKVSGAGTAAIRNWPFHNLGTVDVQAGKLTFDSSGGGSIAGVWTTAAGTVIEFGDGSFSTAGANFSGAGTSRVTGGSWSLSGAAAPTGLLFQDGTVRPTASFQGGSITNLILHGSTLAGTNSVTGSLITTNGTFRDWLTIASTGVWQIRGAALKLFNGLTLNNFGLVRWQAGELRSQFNPNLAAITNAGIWQIETDAEFNFPFGGAQPLFVNMPFGTLRKVSGAGTATFNNWPWKNFGIVDVQAGTLRSTLALPEASGIFHLSGTGLRIDASQNLTGRLQGYGLYTGNLVNAGTIAPTNNGVITIQGKYDQNTAPGPRLEFTLGGFTAGTNHSLLRVNGAANLGNPVTAGSLVVKFANGFITDPGDRFNVLVATSLLAGPANEVESGDALFEVQTNPTTLAFVTLIGGGGDGGPGPELEIERVPGQVNVSWFPPTPGFILQSTTNLLTPNWQNVPGSPNPYSVPSSDPVRFFRLVLP